MSSLNSHNVSQLLHRYFLQYSLYLLCCMVSCGMVSCCVVRRAFYIKGVGHLKMNHFWRITNSSSCCSQTHMLLFLPRKNKECIMHYTLKFQRGHIKVSLKQIFYLFIFFCYFLRRVEACDRFVWRLLRFYGNNDLHFNI